jgi:small subunit ribosomal protein S5
MGKSAEVPVAIKKGVEDAKKNMFKVALTDGTVPHAVLGKFGAGQVLIKPAAPGTGIIAGGPIRALFELAGITDVLSKSLGSDNALNMVKAAAQGLSVLASPATIGRRRGKTIGQVYGWEE